MSMQEIEQQQLLIVYDKLVQAKVNCEALLQRENRQGRLDLQRSGEELRLNFDNFADSLDTYAAIEMKNREVDQRNYRIQLTEKQLEKINRLIQSPYFAKVDVIFSAEEPLESFYIGINGFSDGQSQNLIYDWRSPIAELFYNNELGETSYEVNHQQIPVKILNRRQLVTKGNQLVLAFDTAVAIDDEVLLSVLKEEATDTMKEITASIQKEQNVIIRDQTTPVLLVDGVAGSGKTSVVMQRIAYLLYRHRQTITSENVLILSPNEHFIDYISEVLPTLGEKNPINLTFLGFIRRLSPKISETELTYFASVTQEATSEQTSYLRSKEFISFIKKDGNHLLLEQEPTFSSIYFKGKVLISKETIKRLYQNVPKNLSFSEKIQATTEQLKTMWERFLYKQSTSQKLQDQFILLSEEQQLNYFGKIVLDDPQQLVFYIRKLLNKRYKNVLKAIERHTWLDTGALVGALYESYIGRTYTETKTLDAIVISLFIQHLFIQKLPLEKIDFLFIDEVQDYTPAQLFFLAELFQKTQITMVGDEDQAIFDTRSSFAEITQIFQEYRLTTKRYQLQKSYRSSGAITQLFQKLSSSQRMITPVQPIGVMPEFVCFEKESQFKPLIESLSSSMKLWTILTKTSAEATKLQAWFADNLAVTIYPISLAKGLEFDHVVLFDVSEEKYHTILDQRLLYTAVSRAMKTLILTYKEQLTHFFK